MPVNSNKMQNKNKRKGGQAWWMSLTKAQQKAYLKKHPHSKYHPDKLKKAKTIKMGDVKHPKPSGNKTAAKPVSTKAHKVSRLSNLYNKIKNLISKHGK